MQFKKDRFERFVLERNSKQDWCIYLTKQLKLNRSKICDECGFPRSTVYQNPLITLALKNLEEKLRRQGLLPDNRDIVKDDVSLNTTAVMESIESRLNDFEVKLTAFEGWLDNFQAIHNDELNG